jgi:DNA-binding LacI/PurR family transcriptional regulator
MSTVKDVAELAGVSTATVSRVLNNSPKVADDTRTRVVWAMEQLGYRPNRLARHLRKQTTQTIGAIIPDIQNHFFVSVVRSIEDVAFANHHVLLLCNTDDSPAREKAYIDVLLAEEVAGVIICASDETVSCDAVRALVEHGIPVVALDRELPQLNVDTVLTDNIGASRSATDYLIVSGHKRIGLISGPDYLAPGRERRQGYELALASHGIPLDPAIVKITDFTPEQAGVAIRELLDMSDPPTAVLGCSGLTTLEALKEINRRGLRIPDHVALVGFDDTVLDHCLYKSFPLITQSTYELGQVAAHLLFRRLEDPGAPVQKVRLQTQLVLDPSV